MRSRGLIVGTVCLFAFSIAWAEGDAGAVQAELGISRETLDKGYAGWGSHYVEVENKLSARQVVYGTLRETSRFGLTDSELAAGYSRPAGDKWTAVLEGNASASHLVLPKYSVLYQLQYMLDDNWGAHAGLRHTEYDTAVANLGILTLELYQGNYRAAYTLYSGHLAAARSTTSQRVQLSRYYADKSWLGLAVSAGNELENLGNGLVQQSEVQSLLVNGRHWFSLNWALSYEAMVHRQGDYYTRNGIRFGLRRQF